MSDEDLRSLEREIASNPDNGQAKLRLLMAKNRGAGQDFITFWKLRDKKSGHFSNGKWDYYYYGSTITQYFTPEGKQWHDKNALLKFIKKTQARTSTAGGEPFWKLIKNCEIVEYHTLTVEAQTEELDSQMEKFELELLREEKEANLKKIRELEAKEKKLLAKQQEAK